MSDGTLLPVATDEDGIDWPDLRDARMRSLAVDELLRANVEVRSTPPTDVAPELLLGHTIGWSAVTAMVVCGVLALVGPLPNVVNGIGALGFLLAPIVVSDLVSRRRIKALPPDLQQIARVVVDRHVSQVGPVRWRWLGKRVLIGTIGVFLFLLLVLAL